MIFSAYPASLDTPEVRMEFIRRVNSRCSTAIPESAAHTHTFFDAASLESPANADSFIAAFEEVIERVRAANGSLES